MSPNVNPPQVERVYPGRGRTLCVHFESGEMHTFDVAPYVERGPVFAPLADPAEFARVEVVERGDGVAWACGADLSRDTLYLAGAPVPSAEAAARA